MKMTCTWDSTMSMIPKVGDSIWGGLDWSPEEGYAPSQRKQRNSSTLVSDQNVTESMVCQSKAVKYGRIISFGKDVAEAHSSEISKIDFRFQRRKGCGVPSRGSRDHTATDYQMLQTWRSSRCMVLASQPKELYVYRLTPSADCYIPFQIDTSADGGEEDSCLNDGVFSVNGDETACFECWEYDHAPPSNLLLEGRGTQSGARVDIMGNFALIEDIIRAAAGATGEDLGGDQVYTDIFKCYNLMGVECNLTAAMAFPGVLRSCTRLVLLSIFPFPGDAGNLGIPQNVQISRSSAVVICTIRLN
ncbi:phospholipid:diacylglycerol acyltransferase [Actinidia rufa]|uniref:Phospholipid:diacylglycerol acyltransferase n=1 Tax=Actinidia rufa TaxID=165716 RepID=A0A7J0GLP1_9ERIC|nr:phospholipid:diacylglycerol acyltransferase [Actinidia rufa]